MRAVAQAGVGLRSRPALAGGGRRLTSLLPPERQASSCLLEIVPEGQFLVYGLGVSLARMRHPAAARARVPVGTRQRG